MCRPQCLFALVLLTISCASSWDIAVTVVDQIDFYQANGTKETNAGRFGEITALAYDAVYNMLLFVDKKSDNASIFSYNLANKESHALVKRKFNENIQGIAFDPVTSQLFWTDTSDNTIYRKSLKPGAKNDEGTILFKMDHEIPRGIAVDSCRGYLYWTNGNITKATIERSRLDGSEREVIVSSQIYMPVSITIDQRTKTLYWIDDKRGIEYSIESADLDGKNRVTLLHDINHQPSAITVFNDSLYWVDMGYKSLWKYSRNSTKRGEPTQIVSYTDNLVPFGVAANINILDQIDGIPECQELRRQALDNSALKDSLPDIPKDQGLFCLHGVKIEGESACKCSLGYSGERCEISVCQNHCLNGDCTLTPGGEPECRCREGFKGTRCETNICYDGHCLNQGKCTVQDENPTCECTELYEGSRCEIPKIKETTTMPDIQNDTYNCTSSKPVQGYSQKKQSEDEFLEPSSCVDGWDPIRDPLIMVLGILSGLLCVACAVLITKVMKLKRRPRIKKRIIVNKNVTPLTARPDQCEITIENCCNMNICETPCFEPRSTIKPTLLDAKPGKEEKRNLIDNMEYPDD